ncbi:hypothetical protein CABS02_10593, partial [Colletotrichum abscissum]
RLACLALLCAQLARKAQGLPRKRANGSHRRASVTRTVHRLTPPSNVRQTSSHNLQTQGHDPVTTTTTTTTTARKLQQSEQHQRQHQHQRSPPVTSYTGHATTAGGCDDHAAMQPARPLLILLHIVTYRTDTQYTVKRPVPHTAPSASHLTALHRTYNTSYTRAIPYETETRKNNLLNTPFPSQLGICRESIPLPMLPLPHPRQSLREIDSEQTYAYRDLRPDVDRK